MEFKDTKEIKLEELDANKFIIEKIKNISTTVGDRIAINALSGGVDSAAITVLGHRALGNRLHTYFIDSGLMRENEPEYIASLFNGMGIPVKIIDARQEFFSALKGLTGPEEKRQAITDTFYRKVFGELVRENRANYLLHGTNYTDVEETVAGIKRQHNILEQLGIDTQQEFGYKVLEPLVQIRKPGVRKIAEALELPEEIYNRQPFPGPGLAARVIGEITPEKVEIVRKATKIVEDELFQLDPRPFQYLAILHNDRVTGIKDEKRDYGFQIEVRSWESKDAVTASPTRVPYNALEKLSRKITAEVPGVVSVTYNITTKPTSTIEAI